MTDNCINIMVEKKAKAVRATRKTTTVKAATKPAAIFVDADNAGFRAGDVYQALSAAGTSLSVEELEKATGKTEVEVLLGIGWLLKEGKVKGDAGKVVLA
ncbi:putative uncharacterized protein [Prevotella sp. CAG:924]|nr:putative uncharacterized protein [Prevotella sp. CAG:924]